MTKVDRFLWWLASWVHRNGCEFPEGVCRSMVRAAYLAGWNAALRNARE